MHVVNTGAHVGDEVAEMYIHERVASVTRPVIELQGFERVHLPPGRRKTLKFRLGPKELSMLNANMHWVVKPGVLGDGWSKLITDHFNTAGRNGSSLS